MLSPADYYFPTPVGGLPLSDDLAPSIVFAALYGCLAPLVLYRMISPGSRCIMLLPTAILATMRVVDLSLRAWQATTPVGQKSVHIIAFLQANYATGYMSLGETLLALLRCLLVGTTKGHSSIDGVPENGLSDGSTALRLDAVAGGTTPKNQTTSSLQVASDTEQCEDAQQRRKLFRKLCVIAALIYYADIGLGSATGGLYDNITSSSSTANALQILRYMSAGMTLGLLVATFVAATHVLIISPRHRNAALFILLITCLATVPAIYRLVVMRFKTIAFQSTAPGSLNSQGSKATFYVFHILPELVGAVCLFSLNVRTLFETGAWGDIRG
ncbi:hypothetical protein WOLCODRAFT_162904 [Wolfiporia cocos MD-104 SS10]|uniref:Uncharacterized protein n=1 Tax=Wolfiporia cocos (strain MD-104) TaxID=742152 RepID=A0A2H3JQZ0_WOLCO|nr:hypothetical protein WOLCODRAFT_162904 [Wolfiporia cocos MD-104 SS10]